LSFLQRPRSFSRCDLRSRESKMQYLFFVRLLSEQFSGDQALTHDNDPIRYAQHLRKLTRDYDHGAALLVKSIDDLIDLVLGPDVDSASRFVHDDDPQFRFGQPASQNRFLLIAAR